MRHPLALLVAITSVAVGCNDNKLAPEPPRIEVQPNAVLFDAVSPGATSTRVATVTNKGGGTLVVDHLTLGGATPAEFQFNASSGGPFPIQLGPNAWFAVQL